MLARTTRWTLLVLLALLLGGVAWLGTHPGLMASYLSRFAERNLLHATGGTLQIQHWTGSVWRGAVLRDVSVAIPAREGRPAVYADIDTLAVRYRLRDLLHQPLHLQSLSLRGVRLHVILPGERTGSSRVGVVSWPGLTIGDVSLARVSLQVAGSDGRLRERIDDLAWRGSVRADTSLVVIGWEGRFDWPSRDSSLRGLRGRITLGRAGLEVDPLYCRLNDHPVQLRGRLRPDGGLDLWAASSGISAAEVAAVADIALDLPARGDATVTLSSRADTLDLDIEFTGELEPYHLDGLHARGRLVPGLLTWRRLTGVIDGARFDGRGTIDLSRPEDVVLHLQGQATDLDISRGLIPDVADLPRTGGGGWLDIVHHDGTLVTQVKGWLRDGFIDVVPFDSLRIDIAADRDGVRFRRFDLACGATQASLTGVVDTTETFRGRLRIDSHDLGTLPSAWPVPPLRGRLSAECDVSGVSPRFDVTGTARLEGAGVSVVDLDSCTVALTVQDVLGAPEVRLSGQGDGFRLSGVPLGRFDVAGVVTPHTAHLQRFHAVNGDTSISLRGQVALRDTGSFYYVPELTIDLEGSRWALVRAARLETAPGVLAIQDFRLASPGGALAVSGRWDEPRRRLQGTWSLERFDLDLLNPFLPAGGLLNGEVTAGGTLGGTPAHPSLSLRGSLVDADYPLASIDSLAVVLDYRDGTVSLDSLDLRSDYGRVVLRGTVAHPGAGPADFWPGAALDLDLAFREGDWAFLEQFAIPALDRLAGRFTGEVHLGGTTLEPVLAGRMESAPFHVHWLHLDELSGRIGYEDGILTLADLEGRKGTLPLEGRIELPLELDLLHEPVSPPDGPLYMSFTIPDGSDLTSLADATNAFAMTGGSGGLSLLISGPAIHPRFSGKARVDGGRCVLRNMSEVYRDVSLRGTWEGDTLTVTWLEAREGMRGRLRGKGVLAFQGLKLTGFHFDIAGDRYLFASVPDLRAVLRTDDLAIDGVPVGPDSVLVPRFSGPVEILEARYEGDFQEQPGVSDPRQATVVPDWLADLDLHAEPHAISVINSTMELHMSGDVRLVRDEEGMFLRGSLEVNQGHLPVFNNDFKVTSGRIDFSSVNGVIPVIDLTAETAVRLPATAGGSRRLERITVRVTGNAQQPEVSFDSESGYPRANIERMLLGLSPHATDTQTTSVLETQALAAGFNLLERDIARELEVFDTVDIESGRVRVDGTTQTMIGVGKYIGRDLYVKFSQSVADPDREVLLEYQLTDHLLLQSEIQRRQDEALGNTTYSLDLKYRFEY